MQLLQQLLKVYKLRSCCVQEKIACNKKVNLVRKQGGMKGELLIKLN